MTLEKVLEFYDYFAVFLQIGNFIDRSNVRNTVNLDNGSFKDSEESIQIFLSGLKILRFF